MNALPATTSPTRRFHYGKSFLTPQECAEHTAAEAQVRRFHPCPGCEGGKHKLERCAKCEGRGFYLSPAVALKYGVTQFLPIDQQPQPVAANPQRRVGEGMVL